MALKLCELLGHLNSKCLYNEGMSQELENKRQFCCAVCGNVFSPAYRLSRHRDLTACSKKCAAKASRGTFHRKSDLEEAVIKLIQEAGRYLTKEEIVAGLSISSKTLTSFNVSTLACNRAAGMKRPKRLFEQKVYEALKKSFSTVHSEKVFGDCLSPKGYPLRFDFYLPDQCLLVEADGSQHSEGHPWHKPYHAECDAAKELWCSDKGITLVRIPYTKRVTDEYVFKFLETKVATTHPARENVRA